MILFKEMEDRSHIVEALQNCVDATDNAVTLAEVSLNVSKNAFAKTKLLLDSFLEFDDDESERDTFQKCDNCHAEKCRGKVKMWI